MTVALSSVPEKAAHEPSASPGLTTTPPTLTCRSVRGKPNLITAPIFWPGRPSTCWSFVASMFCPAASDGAHKRKRMPGNARRVDCMEVLLRAPRRHCTCCGGSSRAPETLSPRSRRAPWWLRGLRSLAILPVGSARRAACRPPAERSLAQCRQRLLTAAGGRWKIAATAPLRGDPHGPQALHHSGRRPRCGRPALPAHALLLAGPAI